VLLAAIVVGILFASGTFDYKPEGTYDVLISIKGYGNLHVELYGNDAPETVKHFKKLVDDGYYNGKSIFKLFDDLMYAGPEDVSNIVTSLNLKGEFAENGFDNKISHKRGVLSMARGEDPNSAYGQFFIVRKNSPELDGTYAAFGKVTDGMDVIDQIFEDLSTDENGMIAEDDQPIITSISGHASHSH
jgi:peptidyl-prolyl cis-trans isomerase B (cyclophilin B)